MIPKTYWIIACGMTNVLVDNQTVGYVCDAIKENISINVVTIYGNTVTIYPSKVDCIFESTPESRKKLYEHKIQNNKDWLAMVMEDKNKYSKEEEEVSEVLEEHGLEEAPE